MKDIKLVRALIGQAHEHILKAQAFIAPLIRMLNAKETEMESPLYTMYAADTIKLVKATLEGTTTPMVPFKVDPLEFCREAHEVKDELIRHAMELLENDIPLKQGDGWISVEERMPTEDALYLVYAPSLDPDKPFIKTAWFDPDIVLGWQFIPKVWSDAVTHWMFLPWPPKEN